MEDKWTKFIRLRNEFLDSYYQGRTPEEAKMVVAQGLDRMFTEYHKQKTGL